MTDLKPNISIDVADDHPMVIKGLRDMLSNCAHISLRYTYRDGISLQEGLALEIPDILLLDIQMPGQTGDELVPLLLKAYPDLKILALTNFDNMIYISNMLANGAKGYLLKNTEQDELIEAIETVYEGGIYLLPGVKDKLETFRRQIKRKTSSRFAITPREKDILKLIVNEYSNQEIADTLFLSLRTVENYRLNLTLKLEVKNTAGLVRKAIEMGLLQ